MLTLPHFSLLCLSSACVSLIVSALSIWTFSQSLLIYPTSSTLCNLLGYPTFWFTLRLSVSNLYLSRLTSACFISPLPVSDLPTSGCFTPLPLPSVSAYLRHLHFYCISFLSHFWIYPNSGFFQSLHSAIHLCSVISPLLALPSPCRLHLPSFCLLQIPHFCLFYLTSACFTPPLPCFTPFPACFISTLPAFPHLWFNLPLLCLLYPFSACFTPPPPALPRLCLFSPLPALPTTASLILPTYVHVHGSAHLWVVCCHQPRVPQEPGSSDPSLSAASVPPYSVQRSFWSSYLFKKLKALHSLIKEARILPGLQEKTPRTLYSRLEIINQNLNQAISVVDMIA
jgi:hypothetical protein